MSDTEEKLDAVVVVREIAEDGTVQCRVSTSGDIRLTEIATILELGLRHWRKEVGL